MAYLIWKLIHVLAVIIFLGNVTVNIFWKSYAEKSKDRIKIADTFKGIMKTDRIFTMPSVTFLIIFGLGAAMTNSYDLIETPWILWSIVLVIISAFAFMSKLVPLQKKIIALVSDEERFSWDEYSKLSKLWNFWGIIAVATPYLAVIMMVVKHPN